MGFLSPWFLAGIAAVSIPVWLHLLRQYKRTPRPFSSLMFFERRLQSSVLHRRLKYLLLLALRCALLVLLALAFANPFIHRTSTLAARRKLTIVAVDRSFSMRYSDHMRRAKAEAERVISGLRSRDMAQVFAIDSHVEAMTAPEFSKSTLNTAIEAIQPDDQASSFGEFVRALRVMDHESGMRLDAHFVSDMQQTSMPPNFRDLQVGPHTALTLYSVAGGDMPNWAIESVNTATHVYDPSRTRLTATITGWQTGAATRKVSLVLDGKTEGAKEVAVPTSGRAQAEFIGFDVPYGAHRGEIRLEPQDALPNDDSFPFSIERSDRQKVLFLYSAGRAQEAFYYKAAMESSSETGLLVEAAPIERTITADLVKYAFVVLSDPGEIDSAIAQAICGYVSRGGAVLIALGRNSSRLAKAPLSGDRLSGQLQAQGAGTFDADDPAVRGTGQLENVQFFLATRLAPKPGARVIARLSDGSPLLVEEHMGEGRALILTSALDTSTSDFPLHSSYVPFVVQTGHYLAGFEETASSIVAGSMIALRRTRGQGTAADVIGPDGRHELGLNEASRTMNFALIRNGFYEVQRADKRRLLVAVHADRRESDLRPMPREALELWRNTGNSSAAAETVGEQRQTVPWSLWRYAMLLVLVAAVMESIVARRYLKEERQTG
ncbi:MAG TPA: BatA and WFA domain-containing protein [Bryobacteraceae bacterium]